MKHVREFLVTPCDGDRLSNKADATDGLEI